MDDIFGYTRSLGHDDFEVKFVITKLGGDEKILKLFHEHDNNYDKFIEAFN